MVKSQNARIKLNLNRKALLPPSMGLCQGKSTTLVIPSQLNLDMQEVAMTPDETEEE